MKKSKNFGFVRPDNPRINMDIFVPAERSKGAVTGHKVVVELTSYGGSGKKPEGKVIEILGHENDPGTDILFSGESLWITDGIPGESAESRQNEWQRM